MPRTQSDGTVILPDKFEVAVARKFSAPLSAIPFSIRMAPAAGWGTLRDGQEIVLYNTSPKFSATTTNDDTYRAWPLEPRAVPPSFPAPPRVKFEGQSVRSDILPCACWHADRAGDGLMSASTHLIFSMKQGRPPTATRTDSTNSQRHCL